MTVQRNVPRFCTRSICGWNLFQPLGLPLQYNVSPTRTLDGLTLDNEMLRKADNNRLTAKQNSAVRVICETMASQQTENICIACIQCWANVEDVGPALHRYYTNVLCLLGFSLHSVFYVIIVWYNVIEFVFYIERFTCNNIANIL